MLLKDCYYLGKIFKKFSFKGEVLIKLDTDEPELYKDLESVFINFNGNLIPFFIERSSLKNNKILRIKFEDVNNDEDTNQILKHEIYLPISSLPKLEGKKFYFHEVVGFKVIDEHFGEVGILSSIKDELQELLDIDRNGTQILIPLNDDFIKKIDREKKEFHISAPQGLIELYLEE